MKYWIISNGQHRPLCYSATGFLFPSAFLSSPVARGLIIQRETRGTCTTPPPESLERSRRTSLTTDCLTLLYRFRSGHRPRLSNLEEKSKLFHKRAKYILKAR